MNTQSRKLCTISWTVYHTLPSTPRTRSLKFSAISFSVFHTSPRILKMKLAGSRSISNFDSTRLMMYFMMSSDSITIGTNILFSKFTSSSKVGSLNSHTARLSIPFATLVKNDATARNGAARIPPTAGIEAISLPAPSNSLATLLKNSETACTMSYIVVISFLHITRGNSRTPTLISVQSLGNVPLISSPYASPASGRM